MLAFGDPGPVFIAPTPSNPRYAFDTAAGRYLLLCFLPEGDAAFAQEVDRFVAAHRQIFDDHNLAFFGVERDGGVFERRIDSIPGVRWFLDQDGEVSRACEMIEGEGRRSGWVLIDPGFRVMATFDVGQTPKLDAMLPNLPIPAAHAGVEMQAPVLIVPRVFEPELCRVLIQTYEADGGTASGFMREIEGKTVKLQDARHKVRRDLILPPGPLCDAARARIRRRLNPQIARAFQFHVSRMERDLVACYDAAEQGFFRPHRDNTTKGTAHRRFAVTINLNAEDYEGGDLRFPEFGPRTYRAPTGGAVVFSCSLLHEALPVRSGRRYAFLPFLYDEAAARIREENAGFVAQEGYAYRANPQGEPAQPTG